MESLLSINTYFTLNAIVTVYKIYKICYVDEDKNRFRETFKDVTDIISEDIILIIVSVFGLLIGFPVWIKNRIKDLIK